jgi:hypothetical protein
LLLKPGVSSLFLSIVESGDVRSLGPEKPSWGLEGRKDDD